MAADTPAFAVPRHFLNRFKSLQVDGRNHGIQVLINI
jgi:hypothetical protein